MRNRTALHVAARTGHVGVARELLSRGALVNAQDARGRTPLMEAVRKHQKEVAMLLLDDFSADLHVQDFDGVTAFRHIAMGCNDRTALIEPLLQAGAAGDAEMEQEIRDFDAEFPDSEALEGFLANCDRCFSKDWRFFDDGRIEILDENEMARFQAMNKHSPGV
jgi:ankyrin repeat protein